MKVLLSHTIFKGSLYHRIGEPARAAQEADARLEVDVCPRPADEDGRRVRAARASSSAASTRRAPTSSSSSCPRPWRCCTACGCCRPRASPSSWRWTTCSPPCPSVTAGTPRWCAAARPRSPASAPPRPTSSPSPPRRCSRSTRGTAAAWSCPTRSRAGSSELPPAYEREPEVLTVGWTGSAATHPYDLQVMESGLAQALERTRGRSRFAVLGQADQVRSWLHLPEAPRRVALHPGRRRLPRRRRRAVRRRRRAAADRPVQHQQELAEGPRVRRPGRLRRPVAERGVRAARPRHARQAAPGLGPAGGPGAGDADHRREVAAREREQVLARHLTEHTAPTVARRVAPRPRPPLARRPHRRLTAGDPQRHCCATVGLLPPRGRTPASAAESGGRRPGAGSRGERRPVTSRLSGYASLIGHRVRRSAPATQAQTGAAVTSGVRGGLVAYPAGQPPVDSTGGDAVAAALEPGGVVPEGDQRLPGPRRPLRRRAPRFWARRRTPPTRPGAGHGDLFLPAMDPARRRSRAARGWPPSPA